MPITLICSCGQQQYVAETSAGKTAACVTCGKALTVPAMGKLVGAKAKPASPPVRKSASRLVPALLIAGMATAALGASGFLAWAIAQRHAQEQRVPIAQHQPGAQAAAQPASESRSLALPAGVPEKQEPVPPAKKDPPRIVLERIKPKDESPPKVVVEPVKPKDPPPPIVEKEKEKKPLNLIEPLKLVWKLKAEEVLFQELIVTQKPTYKVQGLQVAAFLQYRIVSRFTVKQRNDDGSLIVEQKIESAKLLQADELTKPSVEGAVANMPGTTYTLTFSPKMAVTKFEGGPGAAKVMQLGGLGMQMTSLIDRDGWKELNQSTFFQMNEPLKASARWSKPLAHSWGPLGSWNGQTHYQYAGQEKDLHKITYGLQLAYKAPKAGAAGLMAVNSANFQPPVAGGVLVFDAAKGRVIAAEERFRVKGIINVNLLGQNTGVEIDEDQHFLIRIHEKLETIK